jgi:hypothetical protein
MARAMVDLLHRAKAAALVIEGNSLPSSNTRLDIGRPPIDRLSEVVANTRKYRNGSADVLRAFRTTALDHLHDRNSIRNNLAFLLLSTSIFATFLLHM